MEEDWELSKENIQPRKEGRDIKKLVAGLTPSKNQAVQRVKEMQEYELALRINDGDDPLDVWYKYIIWTEQNFPMGTSIELKQILERCIQDFHTNEKYSDDERFVKIFLKYADMLIDPSDVFNYMHDQGIGTSHALFYENWAVLLETGMNYKKADEVYQIGIARNAQPLARLQRLYKEFVQRFVAKVKEDVDENERSDKDQRESLAPLKKTTHGIVSHDRVKAKSVKSKGGLGTQGVKNQVQGNAFAVFEDENCPSSSLPAATGEWKDAPVNSKMVKENSQKPAKWTNSKLASTQGVRTAGPAFSIHEDVQMKEQSNTPKQVVMSERKPLCSRKVTKDDNHCNPFDKISKKEDCEFVVRYRKNDVYLGTQEFSLEELRALEPKYALGSCTVYYPADMEETCVIGMNGNDETIVNDGSCPTEVDVQLSLQGIVDNNVEGSNGPIAETKQFEKAPEKSTSSRQRLNFSTIDERGDEKRAVLAPTMPPHEVPQLKQAILTGLRAEGPSNVLDYLNPAESIGACSVGFSGSEDSKARTYPKERNAMRDWDITGIEGVESQGNRYCGPRESTSVHDIQTVPVLPTNERNELARESTKDEEDVPFQDDDLDVGNFSAMLAKETEMRKAKVGFPFAKPYNDITQDQEYSIGSSAKQAPHTAYSGGNPRSTDTQSEDCNMQQYIPVGNNKIKPSLQKLGSGLSAFTSVENRGNKGKMAFSIFDDEEPNSSVKNAEVGVGFSIYKDESGMKGDTTSSNLSAKDSKESLKMLPEKCGFSIFEDEDVRKDNAPSELPKNSLYNGKSFVERGGALKIPIVQRAERRDKQEVNVPAFSSKGDQVSSMPFSIFSDNGGDDIQIPSSPQEEDPRTATGASQVTDSTEFTIKENIQVEPPVKPLEKQYPLQMKRLQCKELTPVTEHKQARIDNAAGCCPIWAPSPTVHTRKARQEIFDMFNKTLECEKNEFTLNQTQELTNRFVNQVTEQKQPLAAVYQAAKPGFEIFEEAEIEPEQGEIRRQSSREEEACGVSSLRTAQYAMGGQARPDRTPNIQQSAQISRTSESQSFSVTRDHINNTFPDNHEQIIATRGASTFCNPAAAPPFLSCTAVVGDFDYMDRHETIQEIDLSKKKLSPIEERSDENKRSSSSSADKSWMNYNGTSSVSTFRMHSEGGSEPEYDRVHHLEHINEADGHTVFEASICDKKGLCTVCQKHEGIAGALDTSLARFPSQLILSEIEEGVSTLAINTTAACTNSSSFEPKPVNPVKEIASMMKALDFEVYPNLYFDTEKELAQRFAAHCKITLGGDVFVIQKKIATGGFSVVFSATSLNGNENNQVVLKLMKSPELCQWEFYIGEEIHRRLDENEYDESEHDAFIKPLSGYVYSNMAIIQYPLHTGGTLLDVVNLYLAQKGSLNETFALLYGLNVCRSIKTMHDCSILHGDVKPDNFLLKPIKSDLGDEDILNCLTLTDFGKCINLAWFSKNTTFIGRSYTDKFECIEMTKDMPWKYQIDYYGIACTLHVVYHGTYMDLLLRDGKYKPVKICRREDKQFWSSVFDRLINVNNCNDRTVLDGIIRDFQIKLAEPKRRKLLEEILIFHSHVASK